jgi:hypothetical protein
VSLCEGCEGVGVGSRGVGRNEFVCGVGAISGIVRM